MPACPLSGTRSRAVQRPFTNSRRFFEVTRPGGRVLIAELVEVVTLDRLTEVHHPKLERPIADFARAVQAVTDVALILVVDPEQLVLPVVRVEPVEIVEEVDFPRFRHARFGRPGAFRLRARAGGEHDEGDSQQRRHPAIRQC
jgi:hypothetical protein